MAKDPYQVLGVSRSATAEEIRRAYRKLAKENHPDLNPQNRLQAEEKLKDINGAFSLLEDETKRRQFDAGLIDANGEPVHRYQSRGGAHGAGAGAHANFGGGAEFGFGDIFSEIFGRGGAGAGAGAGFGGAHTRAKGQDVRYTLDVDFLEAALGAKRRVTLPDGGALDLTVPEGIEDGQTLRLKGKGKAGFGGGPAGDALVEIKVRAHPSFTRQGDDVRATVPISIDEAVIGGKIEVPTISGRVSLTIPKGTSSGRAFRLKGKGIKAQGGAHGDHIVTVQIMLPDQVDDKLAYFMNEWRRNHAYNPRKD